MKLVAGVAGPNGAERADALRIAGYVLPHKSRRVRVGQGGASQGGGSSSATRITISRSFNQVWTLAVVISARAM